MTPRNIDETEALDLQYEFYETPAPFTKWALDVIELYDMPFMCRPRAHTVVCDPCAGDGAIIKEVVKRSPLYSPVTADLDPRRTVDVRGDASNPETWEKLRNLPSLDIDWTITNTPFSLTLEILEQARRFSRRGVALHVRGTINEPLKTKGLGRSYLREHPPNMTLWLPRFAYRRSRTTGKWATDSATCCWLVWCKHMGADQLVAYAPDWVIEEAQSIQKARGK